MKTIMVVDEDRNILNNLKTDLEKNDFKVSTAQTNREAIEKLERGDADIILIHTMVPGEERDTFTPMVRIGSKKIELSDRVIPRNCTEEELIKHIKNIENSTL